MGSSLTVREKEHWKDRISNRIDKKIEAVSADEPNLLDRIRRDAHDQALASLGLSEMQKEKESVAQQISALHNRERQIGRSMLAQVRGVPVEDVDDYGSYHSRNEVDDKVTGRQSVHEEELLAEHEIGKRILALREEKENLLDTVWLATSPREIRELWSAVGELLEDDLSDLQQKALTIEPGSSES